VTALILDSEAFSRLARTRSDRGQVTVLVALRAAVDEGAAVLVPAAVLAEQYRGGPHDQVVDSYLGRSTGIEVVDTTRTLARLIGNLLARAGKGSKDHVDAAVIATALSVGGGVVLTGDPDDLAALAEGTVGVSVETL
jgi:hypothetical protein